MAGRARKEPQQREDDAATSRQGVPRFHARHLQGLLGVGWRLAGKAHSLPEVLGLTELHLRWALDDDAARVTPRDHLGVKSGRAARVRATRRAAGGGVERDARV